MGRRNWRFSLGLLSAAAGLLAQSANPQHALSWQEAQAQFKANNPELLAGQVTIDESRADEVTAYLRPNPDINLGWDQLTPFSYGPFRPLAQSYAYGNISYLHERQHKRELRLRSAQGATAIAISTQYDLERNLLFSLRDAFVRVLLAKAVIGLARVNLDYYDKGNRYKPGAFQRRGASPKSISNGVEIQRIQFLSDLQTATVNLRTAKIDLLALLRGRTPVEQFDCERAVRIQRACFDAALNCAPLPIATRPDLKEAQQALEKSLTDYHPGNGKWLDRSDLRDRRVPSAYRLLILMPASASAFPCASSIATRVRSSARCSTSIATQNCAIRQRVTALHDISIPRMPRCKAQRNFCGPIKTNI